MVACAAVPEHRKLRQDDLGGVPGCPELPGRSVTPAGGGAEHVMTAEGNHQEPPEGEAGCSGNAEPHTSTSLRMGSSLEQGQTHSW